MLLRLGLLRRLRAGRRRAPSPSWCPSAYYLPWHSDRHHPSGGPFPEVWRAVGALDRIVQGAGQCNREGELETGRVVITPTEAEQRGRAPRGRYRVCLGKSRHVLERHRAQALYESEINRHNFRAFSINRSAGRAV
jgi:hypothetical protein